MYYFRRRWGRKSRRSDLSRTFEYLNLYDKIREGFRLAPLVHLKTQEVRRVEGRLFSLDVGLFHNLDMKPLAGKQPRNPFLPPIEKVRTLSRRASTWPTWGRTTGCCSTSSPP